MTRRFTRWLLGFLFLSTGSWAADLVTRDWTDVQGRRLNATFVAVEGDNVLLRTADGQIHTVPLEKISEVDRALAKTLQPAAISVPTSATVADAAAKIDQIVHKKLEQQGIPPNPLTSDEQFVRRAFLQIAGRVPSLEEVTQFLADTSPTRRARLIDALLESPGYTSHLFNYFADMLRIRDPDNAGGFVTAQPYIAWLKDQLAKNVPYDAMVRSMLTADGKLWSNGATGYLLRDSGMTLDNLASTFSIFLGTNVACAQCHDHPFDDWTQMQFYQLAAFFGATSTRNNDPEGLPPEERLGNELRRFAEKNGGDPKAVDNVMGLIGEIVEANRLEIRDTDTNHLRLPPDYKYKDGKPGEPVKPKFIAWSAEDKTGVAYTENRAKKQEKFRDVFAGWLTHPKNPRFALTAANRLWKRAFGQGVAEPVTDIGSLKDASNPELLQHLAKEFVRLKFDLKAFQRILYNTEAWQRETTTGEVAMGMPYYFQGPQLRRMDAAQAWDSLLTLVLADPDKLLNNDKGLMQRVIDIDLAKTEGAVLAQKLDALQKARQRAEAMSSGNLSDATTAGATEDVKIPLYADMKLMRSSELEQPSPAGHFLREFGQSDRGTIDASSAAGSQPQVLMRWNGIAQEMLTSPDALVVKRSMAEPTPERQIESLFLTILARRPTPEEQSKALAQLAEASNEAPANLAWALVNTLEFMFVQ
jgi:hypothetical protein